MCKCVLFIKYSLLDCYVFLSYTVIIVMLIVVGSQSLWEGASQRRFSIVRYDRIDTRGCITALSTNNNLDNNLGA